MQRRLVTRAMRLIDRKLLARIYSLGNVVECNFCRWTGLKFLPAGIKRDPNRMCPECHSLQRYRIMRMYFDEYIVSSVEEPITLLELAPDKNFSAYLKQFPNVNYFGSDLKSPLADVISDLTRMGMKSGVFDFIICFHVFEHIRDDRAGFKELARLLKPGGTGFVMVPISGQNTYEDPTIDPADYREVYGQHDHVRRCGLDYGQRMIEAGLSVKVIDIFQLWRDEILQRFALRGDDRFIFVVKPAF